MDLFVCSSRAEGFSLAIAESIILNIPVLSMNCAGSKELLSNNLNDSICYSYEELEVKIREFLQGKIEYKKPLVSFDTQCVMSHIEDLLVSI
jgi:glycosyltransferase involved in cell wall biosynthesis